MQKVTGEKKNKKKEKREKRIMVAEMVKGTIRDIRIEDEKHKS